MAERLGVTTSAIAAYENGSRNPSFDVLIKIARMFNVTVDNLLGYSSKDYIDISGLCTAQRENILNLINSYKKFNTLIIEMFGIEGDDEDLIAEIIEGYFADSLDAFNRSIEKRKDQLKYPDTKKEKIPDKIEDKEDKRDYAAEHLEKRIKALEEMIKNKE